VTLKSNELQALAYPVVIRSPLAANEPPPAD
jgi:hypothetical protein